MSTPYKIGEGKYSRARTGLIRIAPVFIVPVTTGETDEPWGVLDNWSPPENPLNLPEVERSATKRADGDWELTIEYEGAVSEEALNPLLDYDIAKVEDPIEQSDRFEAIVSKFKGKVISDEGNYEFKGFQPYIKDPATGKRVKNPYFGATHFLNNNPVLRVTFGLKEFRSDLLRNMCKIATPEVPEGTGAAIETPDGMSWLKSSVKAEFRGNIWIIVVEYLLGKWPVDLYLAQSA